MPETDPIFGKCLARTARLGANFEPDLRFETGSSSKAAAAMRAGM